MALLNALRAHRLSCSLLAGSDGSYDDMLEDPDVQVVYVGNVHSFRRETGEKCLKAGKHVLLEKPFACTVADGEYLMGLAKERNLFIMEVCNFPRGTLLYSFIIWMS